MSFTHNLGTSGSPITIMTGVTIPIGNSGGHHKKSHGAML